MKNLFLAKNGRVTIDGTDMDYITFGTGRECLIMLPGLGDGLATVKGKAYAIATAYRIYARHYQVYMFSRKNHLHEGYSTRDMARDQAEAMKILGISKAHILGVSQGGMIAQYLAIDYPHLVDKLVLAVTSSRPNELIRKAIHTWTALAKQKNYKQLMIDTAEKSYSEKYRRAYHFLYPILGIIGKPSDPNRFLIQAASCIEHNAWQELNQIVCPTFVIGGDADQIVGVNASIELSEEIPNSELFLYKGLGHAAYEEAKDFNIRVLNFLTNQKY